VGSYNVTGTDTDTALDTGTWTYTLTVTNSGITQTTASKTNNTTVALSSGSSGQLAVSGSNGTVSYSATGGGEESDFNVTTGGAITTTGQLAVGSYNVTGTDTDTALDTGTWTYTLTVTGGTIIQSGPRTGATTAAASNVFTAQLDPTSENGSAVTFTGSSTPSGLLVSSGGVITATSTLAANSYTISGSDTDSLGDSGSWSYTLTVSASGTGTGTGNGAPSPTGVTLNQTSSTSGVTTTSNSAIFTSGPITVNNATGLVSFATTSSSTALNVSVNGAITTTGLLTEGFYNVAGIDSDPGGDTGTWAYTLTVYNPVSVTFQANGGSGSMTPETKSAPTALTPNTFMRPKHIFAHWNTAANGSGTSYANGVVFPFTAAITLYAQWTATTKIAPTRKVTFAANGGSGSMSPESKNALATLKSNNFQRKGFSFIDWNTAANGSKASYANDAAYRFTKSATLFAQWRAAATFTVTFDANRGSGSMSPETEKATAALTLNRFKRHGFTFDRWNTAVNGSGSNYANGAAYHFNASTILFAQWTVVKPPVVLPAVHAVVALSPFAPKSTALSTSLEAQIAALAREIKANRDKKIALVGYSSDLTTANITNEADWAASLKLSVQRAVVVESYLKQQLALLGVTGYTITAVGNRTAIPASSNATAAVQAKSSKVVATIT
jgi:outer membrane protein OmpA-like peptidoglycan-associated protein